MTENDQAYSKMYESYTLENLNGGSYSVDGFADWPKVFEALKPSYPMCGTSLTRQNFD